MGVERDYLMRQIMMLFNVLQKILRYRKKGEEKEAEAQIQYFYSCLNIEEDVKPMSVETLLQLLVRDKKLTNEQIELVAFVLKEQGEMEDTPRVSKDLFRKAYVILEKVERESTSFSMDRQMKMTALREYLN